MGLLSENYWEDYQWANENMAELARNYPNQWVAVIDKRVIAIGPDVRSVESKAKERMDRAEFPILFVERGIHVYKD